MVTTKTESISDDGSKENDHRHMAGDWHSARGFHYECALRCIWLLELRGTSDLLTIADGEDAKIYHLDGTSTFRQAKKREGSHWDYDKSFGNFVTRAYERFKVKGDSSVRHEFYTNQAIPFGCTDSRKIMHLDPRNKKVIDSAAACIETFCSTVSLYPGRYHPDPSTMLLEVKEQLRRVLDSAYPGCQARNFVNDQEIAELAGKLLIFEHGLWSRQTAVGWSDVDACVGLESLISGLRSRSMADGTLHPFVTWRSVETGGPDNEKTRAVEAVRDGGTIPRSTIESLVWEHVNEWWAAISKKSSKTSCANYLVIVLTGAHGTGKTWSLMRIGSEIPAKYDETPVYIAADCPPSHPFAFGNLAISQPKPCAILIDDFFADWRSLVLTIGGPPPLPHPVLVLATAHGSDDGEVAQVLFDRLGRRARVVEVPDNLDDIEAANLATLRHVPMSLNERERVKTTNIRRLSEILSGDAASGRSDAVSMLLSNATTQDVLGPILLFASLRVAVPKGLLERCIGEALPPEVQAWVLGSRGTAAKFLYFVDPDEAASLLKKAFGGALFSRVLRWCEQFAQRVDPERPEERAFARSLFGRIARKDWKLCEKLLASCRPALDAVMALEPPSALIFSWLPILAQDGRDSLLELARGKVLAAPETVAEITVLIEAYGTASARARVKNWLGQLPRWNPVLLGQFIEAVMALPKEERRDPATKLTSLLVDLPMDVFVETLTERNCFQESTSLASDFGQPHDRRVFLARVGDLTTVRLESGRPLKQNWFEASLLLTRRVISQARSGLAMEIVRQMFINGQMQFQAKEYYMTCFEQERTLAHQSLINLGLMLLRNDSKARSQDTLPPVTGNLVAFASSWGDEGEWSMVADAFIELLESLSSRNVSFDRISAVVLPAFSGLRRGPQQRTQRFLKAMCSWIPVQGKAATHETAKLVFRLLGFWAEQSWIGEPVQAAIRKAFLALVTRDTQVAITVGSLFKALGATVGVQFTGAQLVQMPDGWIDDFALASEFMHQVGKMQWESLERITLIDQMTHTWKDVLEVRQNFIEALLRTGDITSAKRLAEAMANDSQTYPDFLGYLAIVAAKEGDANSGQYLARAAKMQDEHHRGLHLYLARWVHSELAGVSEGKNRAMHLLCAELCWDRPLRPYDEVAGGATE